MKRSTAWIFCISGVTGLVFAVIAFNDSIASYEHSADYQETISKFESAMAGGDAVEILTTSVYLCPYNRTIAQKRISKMTPGRTPGGRFLDDSPEKMSVIDRRTEISFSFLTAVAVYLLCGVACFAFLLLIRLLWNNGWRFFLNRIGEIAQAVRGDGKNR